MEKSIKLKASKKINIIGILNSKKKSDKLVIFCHGLTGSMYESKSMQGVKLFTSKGYDTFRIDFYGDAWQSGRTLLHSTISTHVLDLNTVLDHFKNKYKKIYLVGHSLGGSVI